MRYWLGVVAVAMVVWLAGGCGDDSSTTADTLISFRFDASLNASLASNVNGVIGDSTIDAHVPAGTDVSALVATFDAGQAAVTVNGITQLSGVTANNFTSPVTYHVAAAGQPARDYVVTVTAGATADKALTAFVFAAADNPGLANDVVATISGASITATVSHGTDRTHLIARFVTTGASVTVGSAAQVSGTTANDFTSPVTYQVTAGDGTTTSYLVSVSEAAASDKAITAFAFTATDNAGLSSDVVATISGASITATVPHGTNRTQLIARFTTTGASVAVGSTPQVSGTTANDFTSPVTYQVTAADGSTASYVVTVSEAASSDNSMTAFSFMVADNPGLASDVSATISGISITATVPSGTNLTQLVARFSTTGASVSVGSTPQVSGTTANDFTNQVTYQVIAADGSTRSYVVTVNVAPSTSKSITAFQFDRADNLALRVNAVAGTISGTTIDVRVPYGTDVTSLAADFLTTGVSVKVGTTVQTNHVTANDFSGPVMYVVTAQDGSTQTYTVTVTVNSQEDITSFALLAAHNPGLSQDAIGTITEANGVSEVDVWVPAGTDLTNLVATFTITGTSVDVNGVTQVSSVTANDFSPNLLGYNVHGADGTSFLWGVDVAWKQPVVHVAFAGGATGEVQVSANGFSQTCQASCDVSVPPNVTVTITAATPSTFGGIAGACSTNQSSCSFTSALDTTVTATFTKDSKEQWTFLGLHGESATAAAYDSMNALVVSTDSHILKFAADGTQVWSKGIAGVNSLATDSSNDIYALGSGSLTKLDATGTVVWSISAPDCPSGAGNAGSYRHCLEVAPNGHVVFGGASVAAWGPDGTLLWSALGDSTWTYDSVAVDSSNTIYVAKFDPATDGIVTARFAADGTRLADFTPSTDYKGGIASDRVNNRLLIAASGFGSRGVTAFDTSGMAVFSSSGAPISQYTDLGAVAMGTGEIAWVSTQKGITFDSGFFAQRINATGTVTWSLTRNEPSGAGDPVNDYVTNIAGSPDGHLAIVGLFDGTAQTDTPYVWIQTFAP